MSKFFQSDRPYNVAAAIVFVLITAIFAYMGVVSWLPALLLAIGFALTLRQILKGHRLDVIVCAIIFGGAFFSSFLDFFGRIFLPALFVLGGVYFILRQFFSFQSAPKAEVVAQQPSSAPAPPPAYRPEPAPLPPKTRNDPLSDERYESSINQLDKEYDLGNEQDKTHPLSEKK